MRLGFDLDGVLANLHLAFSEAALHLFPELDARIVASPEVGASPPDTHPAADAPDGEAVDVAPPPVSASVLTPRQVDAVWDHLCGTTDFWETLSEIEEGTVARLAATADARRWEVMFLTSRPPAAGRTIQRQSQRWLERLGFPLPSVYVVHGSRGRIADALDLDVVVDDRPDGCLDVALESRAKAILIWRGSMQSVPAAAKRLGIGVEPTVASCLEVLVEADRAADTPADFVQRLRRLLGLVPREDRTPTQ
jgi:hypothetical protein